MAISKVYINKDYDTLVSFLTNSGLFDSVERFSSTITCKDANDKVICTFSSIDNNMSLTVYYQNSEKSINILYSSNAYIDYGYSCANGVMLNLHPFSTGVPTMGTVLLAKTNNGEVAVIFTSTTGSGSDKLHSPYHAICLSDVDPLSTFQFYLHAGNQTKIVAFSTNNDLGTTSFTPNAGYMPVGQNYDMGYGSIVMDGVTWLTNGYWAIKDS
jgi:hypothetical protein